ncbi:hypothetical protein [Povalibacter sp.]|uniref:hypothetical protein n=1 Tax=Povalibacter sp. TaxID=1962978 RepID=UPI002F404BB8
MNSSRRNFFSTGTISRGGRWAAIGIACTFAAGCEIPALRPAPQTPVVVAQASEDTLSPYLDTMNGLASTDPARQADVFYEAEREYTRAPTTASTLRYASALVTPDHPASKPAEGKKLLETLLATPERMTHAERTLALVLIYETNARLRLEAENRRLLATLDDRGRSQANSDRRVQAQLEENARLRRALAETQQKLEAIKEIEKDLSERSTSPPGNRDLANSETQSPSTSR